jgi:O-antigen/teichoic acid export membrane protein
MFRNILKLAKESFVYGLSSAVSRFFNFLLVPFYTHFLLTDEYGLVALVYSYIIFFTIIYQFGMDNAYLRFASDECKDKKANFETIDFKNIFSTSFWSVFIFSIFISTILFLFKDFIASIAGLGINNSYLVVYSTLIITFWALNSISLAHLRLTHKPWFYAGVTLGSVIVHILFAALFVGIMKLGIKGVFGSAVLSAASVLVFTISVIFKNLRFCFDKKIFAKMFDFAWPFLPMGLGIIAVQVLDKPILMFLSDAKTLGIYQVNYKLAIIMLLVVTMFDQAWRPFFLEHKNDVNAKEIFAKVLTYFTFCSVWIIFAVSFFISDIVQISFFGHYLINQSYWEGLKIIPVILTGYLFYGFYINFMVFPVLSKNTKILVEVSIIATALNLILNFVLIKFFGMWGAAFAGLISYFAMAVILFIRGAKLYPVFYEWRRIIHIGFVSLVLFIIQYLGNGGLVFKFIVLCSFPVLFFVTGFFTKQELAIFKRKFFGK